MTNTVLNDKRVINLLHNGGFSVWERGATLGGNYTGATTTASSTAVSGLTNVVTNIRVGMTVTGPSIPTPHTVASLTSNTAIVLNSSTGVTTATGTATPYFGVPNDTYFADRWYTLSQTSGISCARSTGNNARYSALLTQNAYGVNQGFGIAQVVSANDTFDMIGDTVQFQATVQTSSGVAVNAAILEWTGTADTVTSNVVNSWAGTNYTTGNFFNSANLKVVNVATFTPTAPSTWTYVTVSGQVDSSCNNLIVVLWTALPQTTGSTMSVTECGLYDVVNMASYNWFDRPYAEESLLCRHFFERLNLVSASFGGSGFCLSSTIAKTALNYSRKIKVPTVSFVGLPADVTVYHQAASTAATAVSGALPGQDMALVSTTVASGLTAGEGAAIVDSGNTTHPAFEVSADL